MPADTNHLKLFQSVTLSGASVTSNTLSTSFDAYLVVFDKARATSGNFYIQFNGDSGSNYNYITLTTTTLASSTGQTSIVLLPDQTDLHGSISFVRPAPGSGAHGVACSLSNPDFSKALALKGNWTNTAAITSITFGDSGGGASLSGKAFIYGYTDQ